MNKGITYILTSGFVLLFLTNIFAQTDSIFVIKGLIDTIPHARYFVKYYKNGKLVNDTVELDQYRKFKYVGAITEPTVFYLNIKNTINPRMLGDFNIYEFWIEPGKTFLFGGKTGWLKNGMKGFVSNPKQFCLKNATIEKIAHQYKKQINDFYSKWEIGNDNLSDPMTKKQALDSLKIGFIQQHAESYYAAYLLQQFLKASTVNFYKIEILFSKLSNEIKDTYLGKEIEQRIAINKAISIGSIMPDFEQTDTSSKQVKLSDFRGKYVLVDFWASWCVPCRHDNPRLVKIYERFSDKNFNILGISLDEKKGDWLQAIHHDGLPWTQVSDLKGFDNAVAKGFFIHAVPTKFLLDPNGVIIARDFNSAQLERKLEEIFSD